MESQAHTREICNFLGGHDQSSGSEIMEFSQGEQSLSDFKVIYLHLHPEILGTSACEFGQDTIQPILAGEVVQMACN